MRPFRATRRGFVAGLDTSERLVLAHVVGDTAELLQEAIDPMSPGLTSDADPALRRLLPDASRDDAEVSSEFRRFTQDELAGAKVARLVAFADLLLDDPVARAASTGGAGGGVSTGRRTDLLVTRDAARDTASVLTDVRLVLAERLGVRTDEDSENIFDEVEAGVDGDVDDAPGDGPDGEPDGETDGTRKFLGAVYVTLGWLQESLVAAMLDELRSGSPRRHREAT